MRRRVRELIAYFGGKVIHPVLGLPGGVSKGLKPEDLPQFKELAKDALDFALFTLQVFKDIVLKNPDYVKLITADTYTHRTYYMGLVDAQNKVNFYDGLIRVVDSTGKEYAKFPAQQYRDFVAEHVEPWSYVKFCFLKPLGWHGFEEGPQSSIYAVAPLARLNAADGMATPQAQKAYEEFFNTLGGKPVHHTLANHWARVVEMIQAAERMVELINDPEITSTNIRVIPTAKPSVGIGVVEAPRGTLFHHYETDENGLITNGQPDRRHAEQRRPHCDERGQGRQGTDQERPGERGAAEHGRDGVSRLRSVFRLRDACVTRSPALARQYLRPRAEPR